MSDPHGGRLAVDVLQRHGVDVMFTLSGGHLFVLYDGAVQAGLRLVDVRIRSLPDVVCTGRHGAAVARVTRPGIHGAWSTERLARCPLWNRSHASRRAAASGWGGGFGRIGCAGSGCADTGAELDEIANDAAAGLQRP